MLIFFYITALLLLLYGLLIHFYRRWWLSIPSPAPGTGASYQPAVTVLIPARNEALNIAACLRSLLRQQYPAELLQIIVINDHSTDNTAGIVNSFVSRQILLIHLADYVKDPINSYKKKAIEIGIGQASGELIVTTDADCVAGPEWIKALVHCYVQQNAAFIAAPVKIEAGSSLLSIFQSLDFLTLQGITGASVHKRFHSMCNGANLAYAKKVFYEVNGFKGIDNIASGDDMLLMHKIFLKYPGRTVFLKDPVAIIRTRPADTWRAFIQQRIRWASKADKYDDKRIFGVLVLVYLLNVCLLAVLLAGFAAPVWFAYGALLIFIKFLLEITFVNTVAGFFRMRHLLIWFPFLQPLHIGYTVAAGFLGKFGAYQWKGRKVK